MIRLIRYLKGSVPSVLAILALLFLQAYCDLSLPSYTSDIVNVGIQEGGVSESVPNVIRSGEMEKILLFVRDDDRNTILNDYEEITRDTTDDDVWQEDVKKWPVLAEENIYRLKDSVTADENSRQELKSSMDKAILLVYTFESSNDMASSMTENMKQEMEAQTEQAMAGMPEAAVTAAKQQIEDADIFTLIGKMPEESRGMMLDKIDEQLGTIQDSIVSQTASSYIRGEYAAIGIDVDAIRSAYIRNTGIRMLQLAALGAAAAILVGLLGSRVAAKTGRNLRSNVYRKVIQFSSHEFDEFSTASLITRSTNDIQQIQTVIVMMLRIVLYAPILGIGGVIRVFQIDTSMTWIIGLAVIVIIMIVLVLFLTVMPRFKKMQSQVDRLNLVSREILTGIPVIRAFTTEKYEEGRFDKANRDLTDTNLFVNRVMSCMMPTMMLVMNLICVLIVWKGGHEISAGQMQVGNLMAFIQYTMQIILSFLMICLISIILPRASVAAERIDQVLHSKTTVNDREDPDHLPADNSGAVQFDHVSFRYPGAEEDVLHDLSFTARPGETTAVIGSTGSGKSTLVNLIPRFYDVTDGSIRIDNVDIRDITQHELRDQLGFVPQKGVLFSGTIASNIAYGKEGADEAEIKEAAEIAQASEFIDGTSSGYESYISQGGSNVSGGQKQRLSIARAIARRPKIYVFDDSFSALDYKTDVTLRNALRPITTNSTVIIVAQRISTILHANQILVLDDGRIAGIGRHEELMKNCEVYRQIALSQLSEKELAQYGGGVCNA